jgi:hypothetical protein
MIFVIETCQGFPGHAEVWLCRESVNDFLYGFKRGHRFIQGRNLMEHRCLPLWEVFRFLETQARNKVYSLREEPNEKVSMLWPCGR